MEGDSPAYGLSRVGWSEAGDVGLAIRYRALSDLAEVEMIAGAPLLCNLSCPSDGGAAPTQLMFKSSDWGAPRYGAM